MQHYLPICLRKEWKLGRMGFPLGKTTLQLTSSVTMPLNYSDRFEKRSFWFRHKTKGERWRGDLELLLQLPQSSACQTLVAQLRLQEESILSFNGKGALVKAKACKEEVVVLFLEQNPLKSKGLHRGQSPGFFFFFFEGSGLFWLTKHSELCWITVFKKSFWLTSYGAASEVHSRFTSFVLLTSNL